MEIAAIAYKYVSHYGAGLNESIYANVLGINCSMYYVV